MAVSHGSVEYERDAQVLEKTLSFFCVGAQTFDRLVFPAQTLAAADFAMNTLSVFPSASGESLPFSR